MTTEMLLALQQAAKKAGRPLLQHEIDAINKNSQREALRQRFIKVIRGAGYVGDAPERICAEHFDEQMKDVPGFIKMMESYERNQYDPE